MDSNTKLKSELKKDALLFGKVCFPNMFTEKSPRFHRELVDLYHNENIKKAVIQAPRGFAKSSILAKVCALHHIIYGEGVRFVVIVSKTEGHGKRILHDIKNMLNYSQNFQNIYGYWGEQSAKSWTKTEIMLKNGSYIMVRGSNQQIAGLNINDQRPTLVIYDDPEDPKNTINEEKMKDNMKNLYEGILPALNAKIGRVIVIGTPFHAQCMVEVLHKSEGWVGKKYKAIQDDGTSLWEELFPIEDLLAKKQEYESDNKSGWFYSQYQCTILPGDNQLFKEEYYCEYGGVLEYKNGQNYLILDYRKINKVREDFTPPRKIHVNVFIGIDPAVSLGEKADFFVIMPVAIDNDNNRYVLPYYRSRVSPSAAIEKIIAYNSKYKPVKTSIETSGQQEVFRDILRNLEGIYIPGLNLSHNPRGKKEKRHLDVLEPFFFKRKVFMLKEQTELYSELLMSPNGEHDDTLDGLYYAFKGMYKPNGGAVEENNQTLILNNRVFNERSWMSN